MSESISDRKIMGFPLTSSRISLALWCVVIGLVVYIFVRHDDRPTHAPASSYTMEYHNLKTHNDKLKAQIVELRREIEIKKVLYANGRKKEAPTKPKIVKIVQKENNTSDLVNKQLKYQIINLKSEIEILQQKNTNCTKLKTKSKETSKPNVKSFIRRIPKERYVNRSINIDNTLEHFQNTVTVIIYNNLNIDCLVDQLKNVVKFVPKIKVIVSTTFDHSKITQKYPAYKFILLQPNQKEGYAVNTMVSMVTTEYLIYLNQGATFYRYNGHNGPGWLLNALENIPELDVVGGGIVWDNDVTTKYARYEIQCHRLKMCYWTLRQTYEYQYSVSDMMVCEETSSSFMARTRTLAKLRFDPNLDTMATTDFFWRGKNTINVGLLPEVFLYVSNNCKAATQTKSDISLQKQSFMDKYDLRRIEDSYGAVTNYPDRPYRPPATKSVLPKMVYQDYGGFGEPYVQEDLRFFLRFMDEFFRQKNITYETVAGVALGGIKSRDVLPWDTGDVDTGFYGLPWKQVYIELQKYVKENGPGITLAIREEADLPAGIRFIRATRGGRRPHDDIYSREYAHTPRPEQLMTITINQRQIPVSRGLFDYFRRLYGNDYLRMQNKKGDLKCSVPGHHACVPEEFSQGGGYWSDFYCHW